LLIFLLKKELILLYTVYRKKNLNVHNLTNIKRYIYFTRFNHKRLQIQVNPQVPPASGPPLPAISTSVSELPTPATNSSSGLLQAAAASDIRRPASPSNISSHLSDSLNSSFASSSSGGADHRLRSWDRHNLLMLDASLDRSVVMRDLAHLRSTTDDAAGDGGHQPRRQGGRRESSITLTTLLSDRRRSISSAAGRRPSSSSRTAHSSAVHRPPPPPPPPPDNNNYMEGRTESGHLEEEEPDSLPDNYGLAIGKL
jgi:hypothetical protein